MAVLPHDNYYRHRPDLSDEVAIRAPHAAVLSTCLLLSKRTGKSVRRCKGWHGRPETEQSGPGTSVSASWAGRGLGLRAKEVAVTIRMVGGGSGVGKGRGGRTRVEGWGLWIGIGVEIGGVDGGGVCVCGGCSDPQLSRGEPAHPPILRRRFPAPPPPPKVDQ